MKIDQTLLDALSHKAVEVLGREVILQMSKPQLNLLDQALGRVLKHHNGDAASVTPEEIVGQWEQIMYHVLPTGSHEHFLPSKA